MSDHHHLWSPVEDLPGGRTAYECVVPGCTTERVVEGAVAKWGDRFVDAEGVEVAEAGQ